MANYIGKSSVWNEEGELLGQLGDTEEGLILFDTKSREIIRAKRTVDR